MTALCKSGKLRFIFIGLAVFPLSWLFGWWQNNGLVTTTISYGNPKVPASFDGFTIVHISDLHNKKFGNNQSRLLNKIRKTNPDLIAVTGDLIDSSRTDMPAAMAFIEGAVKLAPVYFVTGNHESWSGRYPELREQLAEAGVILLDDRALKITRDGEAIALIGLSDPAFPAAEDAGLSVPDERLKALAVSNKDAFTLLLSHRPELFDIYADRRIDLVFAGHAHGGQFRLPFVGGLVAPDQGFFPKYTGGSYTSGGTTMIVSRGLGNSIIPLRLFNRPEIVTVSLRKE